MPDDGHKSYEANVRTFTVRRLGREQEIARRQQLRTERRGGAWRVARDEQGAEYVEVQCRTCGQFYPDGRVEPWQVRYCEWVPRPECRTCRAAALLRMRQDRVIAEQAQQQAEAQAVQAGPSDVLAKVGVPQRYLEANLEACADVPAKMVSDLQMWAAAPKGLLSLLGVPGSGKTFVAVALLRWLLERGVYAARRARFLRETDCVDLFRSPDWLKAPTAYDPRRVSLLVYDDLGSMRLDDRTKPAIAGLLERRYADELPTIVTSNLSMSEISTHLDPRVASRMSDGLCVEFPRVDLRRRKKP